jgi:hypothetical protein
MARWSPDSTLLAVVLLDLQVGDDNQPVLSADAMVSNPRLAFINAATGDSRDLKLQHQDVWTFYPVGHLEWR